MESMEEKTPGGPPYDQVSFWLESMRPLTPRPPLGGDIDVDVAVLGAGFTGLWTALYLLRRDPGIRVAVVEQHIAGFGASGRNGGWCSSKLGLTDGGLQERYGLETARRVRTAMHDTVAEVGRICAETGIDAEFRQGGLLLVARGRHQWPGLQATHEAVTRAGGDSVLLEATEVRERVDIADVVGGLYDPHCATIHPGRLVRGLAEQVEARGGTIYEQTQVREVISGGRPTLRTVRGDVRADTIVLAGEAYLTQLPRRRRRLLPIYSLIVLTRPLDDEEWARIGWENHECVASNRHTVDYLSRTTDGRILFGGRGAPYHFSSDIQPGYDRDAETHERLRRDFAEWFPALRHVEFTHAWGGPLAMPRDWTPNIFHNPRSGLAGAYGYTGQGVGTSNLAGRVLADLITEGSSPLEDLPMVGHRSRSWEPEPLRWLATNLLQRQLFRLDERGRRTGKPPTGRSIAERLMRH